MYTGVDCGLNGAICFIDNGNVEIFDMPTIKIKSYDKSKRYIDIKKLVEIFRCRAHKIKHVLVEKVQSMPGQGSVSGVTIGINHGILLGILETLGISYSVIHPKEWQKFFNIKGDTDIEDKSVRKKKIKLQGKCIVEKKYPSIVVVTCRGRLLDGRVDACLIANYCQFKYK